MLRMNLWHLSALEIHLHIIYYAIVSRIWIYYRKGEIVTSITTSVVKKKTLPSPLVLPTRVDGVIKC